MNLRQMTLAELDELYEREDLRFWSDELETAEMIRLNQLFKDIKTEQLRREELRWSFLDSSLYWAGRACELPVASVAAAVCDRRLMYYRELLASPYYTKESEV